MNKKQKGIIESLLFACGDDGLTIKQLAYCLDMSESQMKEVMYNLISEYEKDKSKGFMIKEVAGTFLLGTKKEHAPYIKKLAISNSHSTLSQAALETLAIIAYNQPITRIEIEDIRGVKTDRPIQTLMAKGLIKEVGRSDKAGRAYLYGTTKEFLAYFGLKNIKELPSIKELNEEEFVQEEADLFFEQFKEELIK